MSGQKTDHLESMFSAPELQRDPTEPIEIRETHISRVLLVGDRAFKQKKAVTLPFVNYGTPQRRLEMCREEIRLNRRLAPEVYLGVRSVLAGPEGLRLGAEDDPDALDYLVEMRRYDESDTLAERLARGEARRKDATRIGRTLAEFHARAPQIATYGPQARRVEREITENIEELLELVEQRSESDRVLAVQRFMHAFLVAHAQLFDARARAGMVREGHGDLRADHVILTEPLAVVDCIEFQPDLREIDVADDLAFLVMDLEARGAGRFAGALLAAYRRAGGDPGSDALIAFYACHRALVRAKVALLRARQLGDTAARGHESTRARDLIALAERFSWRARVPLAIVVCGGPATGKSRLARTMARASGLSHLNSDVIRKRLLGLRAHERASPEAYTADLNRRTYAELGHQAARKVASSGGVVVDATFRHRVDRDAFAAAFGSAAPVVFVECIAPLEVVEHRARRRERRRNRVSDAGLAVVARESEVWEPLDEVAPQAHVMLRSDRPVESQVPDLLALLDERVGWLAEQAVLLGTPHTADRV